MDFKNLEKMFEVMVSLEENILKDVEKEKEDEYNDNMIGMTKTQISAFPQKPRKPSLPLAVSAPSVRRGSVDTRKSLFFNEKNQLNTKVNRLQLHRADSKDTLKRPRETNLIEIPDNDFLRNQSLPNNFYDDSNVYDTISILINDDDIELERTARCKTNNTNRDTLTTLSNDSRMPIVVEQRDSLNILNKKSLRYSNLSDNAGENLKAVEKQDITKLQSAPQSARNSARVDSLYSKYNQSSIDSGVDQPVSMNLSSHLSNDTNNSIDSFSDISDCNMFIHSQRELFTPNNDPPDKQNWWTIPSISTTGSDTTVIINEFIPPMPIQKTSIKSEEERERYLRLISLDMSIKTFSPKAIITFYTRFGESSSQVIDKYQTAVSVCKLLKNKFHKPEDSNWQLIEVIEKENLERSLEDHENIFDIFYSWENENLYNRFIFQENPSMYKIFRQPNSFANEMKNDFEIADPMWVKPANSKWIYATCSIVDYNVYYTTKRSFRTQKDQYSLVNLKEVDIYTCTNGKKTKKEIKAQTSNIIVLKANKMDHRLQENAYLATLNIQQKDKWLEAMKVAKYSFNQLKINYLENQISFPSGFRSQANSDATIAETFNPVEAFVM